MLPVFFCWLENTDYVASRTVLFFVEALLLHYFFKHFLLWFIDQWSCKLISVLSAYRMQTYLLEPVFLSRLSICWQCSRLRCWKMLFCTELQRPLPRGFSQYLKINQLQEYTSALPLKLQTCCWCYNFRTYPVYLISNICQPVVTKRPVNMNIQT